MGRVGYALGRGAGKFCWFFSVRLKVIRPQAAQREGAYILACSHVSHIDPFLVSILVRGRQIDWMARVEYFHYRVFAWLMRRWNVIAVRRFGVPVSAIRTAIARLERGRVVGICPEGGLTSGKMSVLRGGAMKKGVCLIAYRTGVPVLPCVMLGTDKLNRVGPWLPWRRAKLWVAFGERVVHPPDNPDRRAGREAMAAELSREFQGLYAELRREFGLEDSVAP